MSEVKTNEPAKQEGDFSLKGKSKKLKQLNKEQPAITKVSIKEPMLEQKEDILSLIHISEPTRPY